MHCGIERLVFMHSDIERWDIKVSLNARMLEWFKLCWKDRLHSS